MFILELPQGRVIDENPLPPLKGMIEPPQPPEPPEPQPPEPPEPPDPQPRQGGPIGPGYPGLQLEHGRGILGGCGFGHIGGWG